VRRSDLPFSDEIAALRYATFAMTRNRVSFCLSPIFFGVGLLAMTLVCSWAGVPLRMGIRSMHGKMHVWLNFVELGISGSKYTSLAVQRGGGEIGKTINEKNYACASLW